jgi:hypothetical protein
MGVNETKSLVPIERVKERAVRLMQNIGFGENFISALRDRDIVGMTAQRRRSTNAKLSPGKSHKHTFVTVNGKCYGIYPYLRGLKLCIDELKIVQEEYSDLYFYHMLFLSLNFKEALFFFALPRYDWRYDEEDEDYNVEKCWDEIENAVDEDGYFGAPFYGMIFQSIEYARLFAEWGSGRFKFADNGCIFCCNETELE